MAGVSTRKLRDHLHANARATRPVLTLTGKPLEEWLASQTEVVRMSAFTLLAGMRLRYPAELRLIQTILLTEVIYSFMRNKVRAFLSLFRLFWPCVHSYLALVSAEGSGKKGHDLTPYLRRHTRLPQTEVSHDASDEENPQGP